MHQNKPTALIPVVLTLLLLAGCGGCQQPDAPPEPPTTDTGVSLQQLHMLHFATKDPYVGASEFACVGSDFKLYIHQGDTQNHAQIQLRQLPLVLGVSDLQQLVTNMSCTNGDTITHGVVLHYGLDSNMGFDVMLQVVCLGFDVNTRKYSYTARADGYTLDGTGRLTHDAQALSKWYDTNGPGTRYASHVVIDHDAGDQWAAFDGTKDVRSTIFPYQVQLTGLIGDNSLDTNDLLRIDPIAEPEKREINGTGGYDEENYHQGAAWVPVKATLDNTSHPGAPYRAKAADLGSPCPFTCPGDAFDFRVTGLPPRTGC